MVKKFIVLLVMLTGIPLSCVPPCGKGYDPPTYHITGHIVEVNQLSNKYLDTRITSWLQVEVVDAVSVPWSFVNPLYACSPPPPSYTSRITNMEIYSEVGYSSEYPLGENMLKAFSPDFWAEWEFPLDLYVGPSFGYQLNSPPDSSITTTFEIIMDLDDGRSFTTQTPKIVIEP